MDCAKLRSGAFCCNLQKGITLARNRTGPFPQKEAVMSKHVRVIAWFLIFLCSPPALYSQICGGTERWQVKVGTDSGVGSVQLQPHIQTDLQALIHLPEPARPRNKA